MKRTLTDVEEHAIRRVAERLSQDQKVRLLEDLAHATAETASTDGSRVVFHIAGYERPPYRGQRSFGIEGNLSDKDGAKLSFDLFADENGRLLELEVIRWNNENVIDPDWSTLDFY